MKTNKKLTKTILLSSLAIAAFGSVAAGTTYALFTSKAESSITVTTGKVSVSQEVEIKERYTPALINEDGTIADETNAYDEATGFEVTVTDNDVAVTKMLPGDKVTLTITPKNDSNVKIKYRETYAITGDENNVLKVTGESGMITHWTVLEANGTIAAYEVSIEVPATGTEGVEDAKITLGLEAVQGNAKVYDTKVSTKEELLTALNSGEETLSVNVASDIELDGRYSIKNKNLTIYGDNGKKITTSDSRVFNIFGDENSNLEGGSLTLVDVDLVANGTSDSRAINIYGTTDYTVNLIGASLECNYYGINIADDVDASNKNLELVVKGSTISAWYPLNCHSEGVKCTFDDCTLIGHNFTSGEWGGVIVVNNKNIDLTFNNCTLVASTAGGTQRFICDTGEIGSGLKVAFNKCKFKTSLDGDPIEDITTGDYWNILPKHKPEIVIDGVKVDFPVDDGE